MHYIYSGSVYCENKNDMKAVVDELCTIFSCVNTIDDKRIDIESEYLGDIESSLEAAFYRLKESGISLHGEISYCGDANGRFEIGDEIMNLSEEECIIKDANSHDLIEELNSRGYSVYKTPSEPPTPPKDGEETFCVSMKVDGRVDVFVNAPIGNFQAAKKAAEEEFSCNGEYDCGVISVVDSFAVNAENEKGDMKNF